MMISQIGAAVRYIHSQQMIHRDIKADNILMASASEGCACNKCHAMNVWKLTLSHVCEHNCDSVFIILMLTLSGWFVDWVTMAFAVCCQSSLRKHMVEPTIMQRQNNWH